MPEERTEPTVTRSTERTQYELTVDGERAGLAAYIDRDGQRIFHHTEIGENFGGRGLGSTLIGRALADTRAAGLRIVAVCPFVAKYLEKHHEVDDVVDPVTDEVRAAVREQVG